GQITGVEGYVESAASGLMAGIFLAGLIHNDQLPPPPPLVTAHGALLNHVTQGDGDHFQPMNVNFGLFPPLEERVRKTDRKPVMSQRALTALTAWKDGLLLLQHLSMKNF
ncbi:MAG: FAD-dependent oxidoreductase, partial [Magnetococcales bacterium]|nr:FAD-dependent oxidoreductase [Magnetococcales bacterium]